MPKYTHKYMLVCVGGAALSVGGAQAQSLVDWRAISQVSPTVVPLYGHQPSPFTSIKSQGSGSDQASAASESERQKMAIEQMNLKKESLIDMARNPLRMQPALEGLKVGAIIEGPQGKQALITGRWASIGASVQVPSKASQEYLEILQQLKQIDPNASDPMQGSYTHITLKIVSISSQTVVFQGPRASYPISLRQ